MAIGHAHAVDDLSQGLPSRKEVTGCCAAPLPADNRAGFVRIVTVLMGCHGEFEWRTRHSTVNCQGFGGGLHSFRRPSELERTCSVSVSLAPPPSAWRSYCCWPRVPRHRPRHTRSCTIPFKS